MAFGVFIHRSDSIYDDVPSERYQFPRQYLSRAQQCEGDWIVYLEPSKVKDTKGYFAVAKVQEIISDPRKSDMYLAVIEPGSYLDFGDPVPFRDDENIVERGLLNDEGRISGRAQAAVRTLSNEDFARIIERGLDAEDDFLPRVGDLAATTGFQDAQAPFQHMPARERVNQTDQPCREGPELPQERAACLWRALRYHGFALDQWGWGGPRLRLHTFDQLSTMDRISSAMVWLYLEPPTGCSIEDW